MIELKIDKKNLFTRDVILRKSWKKIVSPQGEARDLKLLVLKR